MTVEAGQTVAATAVHGWQTTSAAGVQFVAFAAQTIAAAAVHDGHSVAFVGTQVSVELLDPSVSFLKSPNLLPPPLDVVVLADTVVLLDSVAFVATVELEEAVVDAAFYPKVGKSTPTMINFLVESS